MSNDSYAMSSILLKTKLFFSRATLVDGWLVCFLLVLYSFVAVFVCLSVCWCVCVDFIMRCVLFVCTLTNAGEEKKRKITTVHAMKRREKNKNKVEKPFCIKVLRFYFGCSLYTFHCMHLTFLSIYFNAQTQSHLAVSQPKVILLAFFLLLLSALAVCASVHLYK